MNNSLGILGVGNMGRAIACALSQSHPNLQLHLYNRNIDKIRDLTAEISATIYDTNNLADLFKKCSCILVGVKPKDLRELFDQIAPHINSNEDKLWISMAVGVSLEELTLLTPTSHRWIRMMPNTPIEIQEGVISYALGQNTKTDDHQYFIDLFAESASLLEIPEKLFGITGAIAGSGPALIYLMIEALVSAGVMYGLTSEKATEIVVKTMIGSSQMVKEKEIHPAILRDQVTSPGGTTIQGIANLEKNGMRSALIEAITAIVEATP